MTPVGALFYLPKKILRKLGPRVSLQECISFSLGALSLRWQDGGMLPVVALVGPTASGKSALAFELAKELISGGQPAEIVNADSMLVYRGMNIGTAKPSAAELASVRHHLVDTMSVRETATVAEFQTAARRAIVDCRARGALPILVGGSALYLRAIMDDFQFPGTDPGIREKWERRLAADGPQALHELLAQTHPHVATEILPGNGRRLVRALEVIELTGDFSPRLPEWSYHLPGVIQFGMQLCRAELDERIVNRVHHMWSAGFVSEVRGLLPEGLADGVTAARGLGYQQILAHLAGECSEEQAVADTISGTKRFVRKQVSWFARDPRITWVCAPFSRLGATMLAKQIARGLPDAPEGD